MPDQTILVTGATGYIAKHIVQQLLQAGYHVVGSARSTSREAEMRDALLPHVDKPSLERLRIVPLDLSDDAGWDDAMKGVDVVMHTASPFPLAQPKDETEVIKPAVDGALRAVKAARNAGIKRFIMTSSSAAVVGNDLPDGKSAYDENDWTDPTRQSLTPYVKSKTLAERAIWDWTASEAPEMQITMINPVFVQGPPLDANFGTSIEVVERLMKGKDPMLPNIGFSTVDVRDIALMHIRAMEREESIGHRIIGSQRFLWFSDMARILKQEFPDRKIATRVAPNLVIRGLALFDPAIRSIVPGLGRREDVSNTKAREMLGIEFRDCSASIGEAGNFLVEQALV